MEKRMEFRFEVPGKPRGEVIEVTNNEAEKILLEKLNAPGSNRTNALWELAQFYKLTQQHEKALQRLRELIQLLPDPEDKANCVFTMGQAMEQVGDYATACRYYKEAEALEPSRTFTSYFINNNLGYCLNTLGRFEEGEIYCHRAMDIDEKRPNAHKNLGISFSGQGKYHEAAQCLVTATQVNAADPRAFHLLEQLLSEHPSLAFEFQDDLDYCRKAVEVAAKKLDECRPVVQRGWRRRLILFRMRLNDLVRRFRYRIRKT